MWSSWALVLDSDCEEGDACTSNAGKKGTVQKTEDCKTLPEIYIMKYAQNNHCGFSVRSVLICCESDIVVRFSTDVEKSKKNCEKFGKRPEKPLFAENHIINGAEADVAEFPHFAAIGYNDHRNLHNFLCGGVLISESL